jgi:hypothetical protein
MIALSPKPAKARPEGQGEAAPVTHWSKTAMCRVNVAKPKSAIFRCLVAKKQQFTLRKAMQIEQAFPGAFDHRRASCAPILL